MRYGYFYRYGEQLIDHWICPVWQHKLERGHNQWRLSGSISGNIVQQFPRRRYGFQRSWERAAGEDYYKYCILDHLFGRGFKRFQQGIVLQTGGISIAEDGHQRFCSGWHGVGNTDRQILQQYCFAYAEREQQCFVLRGLEGISDGRKFCSCYLQWGDFIFQQLFQQLRSCDQHYDDRNVHGCNSMVLQ